jgi:hypothetical protein
MNFRRLMSVTLQGSIVTAQVCIPEGQGSFGQEILQVWPKSASAQKRRFDPTDRFPARAQADDELVAALSEATNWKRQGDFVSFIGTKPLRFRPNTN